MDSKTINTAKVASIVALGGLLMGFDASVISGVNKFIKIQFELTELELGFAVSSLALVAAISMLFAGPISDAIGRRKVLSVAAVLYAVSAIGSALSPSFTALVIFRMIGGLGVGASLIIAPMYIAEISPPKLRGAMVSFNQLNIVIGISLAFFTNYLIFQLGESDLAWAKTLKFGEYNWRWMLGLETLPAVLYFFGLFLVPKSPRWCVMKGKFEEGVKIMERFAEPDQAKADMTIVKENVEQESKKEKVPVMELFMPAMRLVMTIGLVIGVLQQITGINSVFFYAPMIFEQSGIGTDSALSQAIMVGLVNLVFTVLAIRYIDKLGRRPLLIYGITGIALCMMLLAYGFNQAKYTLTEESIKEIRTEENTADLDKLAPLFGKTFDSDVEFKTTVRESIGKSAMDRLESQLITASISMNPMLILFGILGFVASFAVSLGPVMWVLLSELFPNRIRGIAISAVGLVNSLVSTGVQWVFPWELAVFGNSTTFLIYGVFAIIGLIIVIRIVPETKGKSLEELETILVKH